MVVKTIARPPAGNAGYPPTSKPLQKGGQFDQWTLTADTTATKADSDTIKADSKV